MSRSWRHDNASLNRYAQHVQSFAQYPAIPKEESGFCVLQSVLSLTDERKEVSSFRIRVPHHQLSSVWWGKEDDKASLMSVSIPTVYR